MSAKPGADFETDCAAAVMLARIAALSPPTLPPGVAERIIREVPRLAQIPARMPPSCSPIRSGPLRAAARLRVVTMPRAERAIAGRWPIAGLAALAAGLGAIALMLPVAFPVQSVAHVAHAPSRHQLAQSRMAPNQMVQNQMVQNQMAQNQISQVRIVATAVTATKLQVAHPERAALVPRPLPVARDSNGARPIMAEPVAQPEPVQIAVAVAAPPPALPTRPVYGPVDTEAAPSSGAGVQRIVGPGLTPGYAFTNHDPGIARSTAHPR